MSVSGRKQKVQGSPYRFVSIEFKVARPNVFADDRQTSEFVDSDHSYCHGTGIA